MQSDHGITHVIIMAMVVTMVVVLIGAATALMSNLKGNRNEIQSGCAAQAAQQPTTE